MCRSRPTEGEVHGVSDVLGFTGTRFIAGREDLLLVWASTLRPADEYVTGACIGFDVFIGKYLAMTYPDAIHRVIVPANRSQIARWWDSPYFSHVTVQEMPPNSTYKQRNQEIVNVSTRLEYCAAFTEKHGNSQRSGTWQTIRMARRKGIPVQGIALQEGAPDE